MTYRQNRIAAAKAGLKQALTDLAKARKESPAIIAPVAFEPLEGSKMNDFEIEMRGRLAMLETLTATLLAHTAAHISDPVQFMGQVMADVERNLERARDAAKGEAEDCADVALTSFTALGNHLLAHINRHADPVGRG